VTLPAWEPTNPQQDREEFDWLLNHMTGARSMLEIGSCIGFSLRGFATRLVPGARIRSIDAGVCYNGTEEFRNEPYLLAAIQDLDNRGFDAAVMIGDSTWPQVINWAREHGPYDFIFIDGGHDYDTVKSDFKNYSPMARQVGLHDIVNTGNPIYGVHKLWREIKESYWVQEKIVSEKGTGYVWIVGNVG